MAATALLMQEIETLPEESVIEVLVHYFAK